MCHLLHIYYLYISRQTEAQKIVLGHTDDSRGAGSKPKPDSQLPILFSPLYQVPSSTQRSLVMIIQNDNVLKTLQPEMLSKMHVRLERQW